MRRLLHLTGRIRSANYATFRHRNFLRLSKLHFKLFNRLFQFSHLISSQSYRALRNLETISTIHKLDLTSLNSLLLAIKLPLHSPIVLRNINRVCIQRSQQDTTCSHAYDLFGYRFIFFHFSNF